MPSPASAISLSPQGGLYVGKGYAGEIYVQNNTWQQHNGQEASGLGKDLLP